MCVAIWKPAHVKIKKETLKICYDNNSDGCGFAYINTDDLGKREIKIKKTMNFDVFYKWYERALKLNPDSPFIIHFRIATHGTVDAYNCHPFKINNDLVFAHNGIISKASKCPNKKKSDTQMFNTEILRNIHPLDLMWNDAIKALVEAYIGGTNKLILMDIDGDVNIFNEDVGNWHEGAWYSNMSYKPKQVYTTSYRASVYNHHTKQWEDKINKNNSAFNKPNVPLLPEKRENLFKPKYKEAYKSVEWEPCCECGAYYRLTAMTTYKDGLEFKSVCKKCEDKFRSVNNLTEMDVYDIAPSEYDGMYGGF